MKLQTAESELQFMGLMGMLDPVRPEVSAAIARCQAAGIRVMMVTGDHPATAAAIARRIGLSGSVRLGTELPAHDSALADLLAGPVAALARVSPEQKLWIARALQSRGEVVAMTGDGVNDAPALRQADIGVAMGASGTDVAREAADLVLLDDDFSHIVEAVEEGRAAFANIRRFLTYHLTDNVAELAPFVCWALSGGHFPLVLSVLQVLALDIGTDLLPALALGAEAPEPEQMRTPPRARSTPLLDRAVLLRAFAFLGVIEAVVSLALVPIGAALFLGWRPGVQLPHGGAELWLLSTLVFASIVLMQMANAYECRATPSSVFARPPFSNRLLVVAVVTELVVLCVFIYQPGLRRLLGHVALRPSQWLLVMLSPVLLLCAEELRKALARRARSPSRAS
jgi:magnesium-transporting ATPase (P-type)